MSTSPSSNGERTTRDAFRVVGAIVIVALVCYAVMAIFNASGLSTMRDVLLGLVAGLTGGYAIARRK